MKKIARAYVIETASLYIISSYISGIVFRDGVKSLLITGLALTAAVFLIKPVVGLLLLPLNLVTFGVFKWVSMAVTLYLIDLVMPAFSIGAYNFPGFQSGIFYIPAISLTGIGALILFSFTLSIFSTLGFWLID